MPTIHHAVSFGPYCRARYQLKRVFRSVNSSGVFDWQITPPAAAVAYLESNFEGMFEIDDLDIEPETQFVFHRALRTRHMHEFPKIATRESLEQHYSRARKRHDYLCGKVRDLLQGVAPVLIAMAPGSGDHKSVEVDRLRAALNKFNPQGTFHLMVEPHEGSRDGSDWRGNDRVWDDALRAYEVPIVARLRAEWRRMLRPPLANLPKSQAVHGPTTP